MTAPVLPSQPKISAVQRRISQDLLELASALSGSSAQPPIDPTNHHNALKCPYCNPDGLAFAHPTQGGDKGEAVGCVCQDQHRRGYCTEPGCPYAAPQPASNAGGTESALKMVAGLFAESVHETYTREEVVSIVEDMIRVGSPVSSTDREGGK